MSASTAVTPPSRPDVPLPESPPTEPRPREAVRPGLPAPWPVRFRRQLLIWTAICTISAAPSFMCGLSFGTDLPHVAAMIIGVATFILGYALIAASEPALRFKRRPFVRRTLRIGYITRLALSVAFPVGLYLDLLCGVLSVGVIDAIRQGELMRDGTFLSILATTLLQGVVLNIVLLVYMTLLYVPQRLFLPRPPGDGHCNRCGYDLRASAMRCPECGAFPSAVS